MKQKVSQCFQFFNSFHFYYCSIICFRIRFFVFHFFNFPMFSICFRITFFSFFVFLFNFDNFVLMCYWAHCLFLPIFRTKNPSGNCIQNPLKLDLEIKQQNIKFYKKIGIFRMDFGSSIGTKLA